MTLIITSSDRTPIPIEVIGLDVLAFDENEKERFLATFRAYLQQLYRKGIVNFQKVEIRGRFSSGQSGAIVFPIMLFTPGLDSMLNHYRVLKYDNTPRVEQEATRFNSLVSQRRGAGVPYEEIQWASSPKYPEKSLLGYRDLVAKAKGLKEFSTYLVDLINSEAKTALKEKMFKALQDVLETLYEHHYCKSNHRLPVLPEFANRKVSEIFTDIFPAERVIVIDDDMQDEANCQEYTGLLIGIEATSGGEYKKKYVVKDEAQNRFLRVDVITRSAVNDVEIRDFLNSSIEHRLKHRFRGQVTKSCSLKEYIKTSVNSSGLPSGMIDADKLYEGLKHTVECPYWAFYLHHDLNPGNILVVERAKGGVQGLLIDYYSFGLGGHLFTDVARLEALTIIESVLSLWKEPFQQKDYAVLQNNTKNLEEALFSLNPQQPGLSREERAIVDVAFEIRRISLNWFTREERNVDVNLFYRNYLFARYAFLLACQKLSSGIHLVEKKQVALMFADALRELIEREVRNLDIAQLLADLNEEIFITDADVQKAETFRKTKETALLIMMFIDMVNSTKLLEELGELRFNNLLQEKKSELISIIERGNTGKLVKDLGDGYLAIFSVPSVAVETALKIQEALASDPEYRVRIGIDMGQVTQESEAGIVKDVFGLAVNQAARIEALCEGGHVLTSYPVWDSAKGWLKHREEIDWKAHGSYWLKGISEPQVIYEPYNTKEMAPLTKLDGKPATDEETWLYCRLCGRYVKLKETFKCRKCGTEGICSEYCFDTTHRQCIECSSKESSRDVHLPFDAQKLIDLQNLEASFSIKIWTERRAKRGSNRNILVVPKSGEFGQYKIGDKVVAYFQSSVDAYVYMINIGPTGDVTHIFPNEYSSDNHVKGGEKHTFPDEDAPFEWILQEPAGTETIKVIATKIPVDIEQFLQKRLPKIKIRNIITRPRLAKTLSPDQWAEASCTLLVQK